MNSEGTGPAERPRVTAMDRPMIRLGFGLILLAFVGGVLAPTVMVNPRLGVGAHLIGLFGGLILIAVGVTRPAFALGPTLRRIMNGCWLGATYGNWVGTMIGGFTGASHLTPIAGADSTGSPIAENVVIAFFCFVGGTSAIAALIAIYGLRSADRAEAGLGVELRIFDTRRNNTPKKDNKII